MGNNITIIVNSCDKYEDLWYPFFELFRLQWPNCSFPIILNTESKEYAHPHNVGGGIRCLQLFVEMKETDWSTRLLRTLEYVDTDYVIMMLDDEFIQSKVDDRGLSKVFKNIQHNPFIANILFTPLFQEGTNEVRSRVYNNYNIVKRIRGQQSSANAAIWKKKKLVKYLKSGESIWEFEKNSKRRRGLLDLSYTIREGLSPIRTSFLMSSGYWIVKGKWLWRNIDLFQEYGINVDFNIRGVITKGEIDRYFAEYWKSRREREEREKRAPIKEKTIKLLERYYEAAPESIRSIIYHVRH